MEGDYDSSEVERWYGKGFICEDEKEYMINRAGRFFCLSGIIKRVSGMKIDTIAGFDIENEAFYKNLEEKILRKKTKVSKRRVDCIIKKYGIEPRKGLRLILSVREEDLKKYNCGYCTSVIKKIE
jgi:hypothetical protein